MRRKIVVIVLTGAVLFGSISGCGSKAQSRVSEQSEDSEATDSSLVEEDDSIDISKDWNGKFKGGASEERTEDSLSLEQTANSDNRVLYPHIEGVNITGKNGTSSPDWSEYDTLIEQINKETNLEEREALMHKAEDILMETAAIIPLYYYNDLYMQKSDVEGIYSNNLGTKYFQFASLPRDALKINLASEPLLIDPALNFSVDGSSMDVNLFSGLYTYTEKSEVVPDLAAATEISDDGMSYTFRIIDGAKWSDGTDVTMKDFLYSWNRASNPATGGTYYHMFDVIARNGDGTLNIEAVDDKTLKVNLTTPCAYFLELCAMPVYFPVPQAQVEAANGWQEEPGKWAKEAGFVTNGAYTVSEWKHFESMVLKKNPNYHKADQVSVEEMDFMLSGDDEAIFATYNSDNLDFADTIPTGRIADVKDSPEFHVIDNLGTYFLSFNVNSPIFSGKTHWQAIAMRKAMSLLIDRQYIAEKIGQTGQKEANYFISEGMSDGHGGKFKENDDQYTYPIKGETGYYPTLLTKDSVESAIMLLKEAGYQFTEDGVLSDSTPLSLTYLTNDGTGNVAIAEIIQQDFAEIGINLNISTSKWEAFLDQRSNGEFDLAREGWIADYDDPINMLEMWTTDSENNDCQFGR